MVYGAPELERGPVLEHGTSRSGRWLRENRVRIAIWIAVAEGLLVLVGAIPKYAAIVIALLVLVGYFSFARRLTWHTGRQAIWIAAASQAIVALVPVLAIIVGTLALVAVGVIAVVALVLLFSDRL
jgi:hypothetical protein